MDQRSGSFSRSGDFYVKPDQRVPFHPQGLSKAPMTEPSKKRGRVLEITDLACPICKELFYDPLVFECGHSVCTICLDELPFPITCPECRTPSEKKTLPINYRLKSIAEASFPEEYQELHKKHELDTWIINKRRTIPSFNVRFSEDSKTEMLAILKILDQEQVWTRSADAKFKPFESLRKKVVPTWKFILLGKCPFYTFNMGADIFKFHIEWERYELKGYNSGPKWMRDPEISLHDSAQNTT